MDSLSSNSNKVNTATMTNPEKKDNGTLDYSFMGICRIRDVLDQEFGVSSSDNNKALRPKPVTRVVKFASNDIEDISDLYRCLSQLIHGVDKVSWIDLSNNKISYTESSLEGFHSVTVLYLHANNISSFAGIKPLGSLKSLTSLTLHGNPIEAHKHYRNYVLHLLPNLEKLDFSLITKQDRETGRTWSNMFRKKLAAFDEDLT